MCTKDSIMNKIVRYFLFSIFIIFANLLSASNTTIIYTLEKEAGHYYTTTTLNGIESRIMIESGIPALLIGKEFYHQHYDKFKLDLQRSTKKIRLLRNQYKIELMGHGQIEIGNAIYNGTIFILDGDIVPLVPIQFLSNPLDGSSIITLDLKNRKLLIYRNKDLNNLIDQYDTYPLYLSDKKMPVVNSTLNINVAGKECMMQGDFIVDMGNGAHLFLMKQHKAVKHLIKENNLKLQEAKNTQGIVVAEGLYADKLTICGKLFEHVSIGVTDTMTSIKEAGFLGLKFFTSPTIFDFGKGKMYIKK